MQVPSVALTTDPLTHNRQEVALPAHVVQFELHCAQKLSTRLSPVHELLYFAKVPVGHDATVVPLLTPKEPDPTVSCPVAALQLPDDSVWFGWHRLQVLVPVQLMQFDDVQIELM